MREKGFNVENVNWSGFGSQGDGASFEGSVCYWSAFWNAHGWSLPLVQELLDNADVYELTLRCSCRRQHYSHSGTMEFDDMFKVDHRTFDTALEVVAWESKLLAAGKEWRDFVVVATKALRDYADDLYRDLEREYDYLTSDEQVLEALLTDDQLETEIERYEPDSTEEDDESQDAAPVQELLLRTPGAVSAPGGAAGHPDAGD